MAYTNPQEHTLTNAHTHNWISLQTDAWTKVTLLCTPRSDVSHHVGLLRYSLRLIQMMLPAIISQYMSAARMLDQWHHLCSHCQRAIIWKRSRAWVKQREQCWVWRRKVLELCRELIIWSRLCRYLSTSTPVHNSGLPPDFCVHGTTTALKNKNIPLLLCHHKYLKMFFWLSKEGRTSFFVKKLLKIPKWR